MRLRVLAVVSLLGCGGPALQNAPRVDPVVVAAGAAAIAGAATLADPDAAARRQEEKKDSDVPKSGSGGASPSVPSDVLDRLDQAEAAQRDAGAGAE
ncbi:MAG TPA: hypothetical protein VKB80_26535 [Kofleriaceae bacterium]|nr:hypothetical protein [Kofleriaceae bacterium]